MTLVLTLARRAVRFELALYRSLLRWLTRRPDVPPDAQPFGYVGAVAVLLWTFIVVSAVETVVLHLLLPWESVRIAADVVSVWGLVWMLGLAASLTVYPHVIGDSGLRVRHGSGTDIDVPWDAIATISVRERSRDTAKAIQLDRDEEGGSALLHVVMGSRTNVDVRLRRALVVTVVGDEQVTELRLYADDARGLVRQARDHLAAGDQPRRSSR